MAGSGFSWDQETISLTRPNIKILMVQYRLFPLCPISKDIMDVEVDICSQLTTSLDVEMDVKRLLAESNTEEELSVRWEYYRDVRSQINKAIWKIVYETHRQGSREPSQITREGLRGKIREDRMEHKSETKQKAEQPPTPTDPERENETMKEIYEMAREKGFDLPPPPDYDGGND